MTETILPPGTHLLHGTNQKFQPQDLWRPCWFTLTLATAVYFCHNHEATARPRILRFLTQEPCRLATFHSLQDAIDFFEPKGLDFLYAVTDLETTDIINALKQEGFEGWIFPKNYQDGGEDILLHHSTPILFQNATGSEKRHRPPAEIRSGHQLAF